MQEERGGSICSILLSLGEIGLVRKGRYRFSVELQLILKTNEIREERQLCHFGFRWQYWKLTMPPPCMSCRDDQIKCGAEAARVCGRQSGVFFLRFRRTGINIGKLTGASYS